MNRHVLTVLALLLAAAARAAVPPVTVELSPCGAVTFTNAPSRILTVDANYNDMLYALGHDAKLVATGPRNGLYTNFYASLPGYAGAFTNPALRSITGQTGLTFDKEFLYALRPDIIHADPVQLGQSRNWTAADIEEIRTKVAPFFANRYSRENVAPKSCTNYAFYTIGELSGKLAGAYREEARGAALAAIAAELEAKIRARLPPPAARPRVALLYYNGGRRFTPYLVRAAGNAVAQYRVLGVRDAFAGRGHIQAYTGAGGGGIGQALDLEGLLAVDPDVIIMPFAGAVAPGNGADIGFRSLAALARDPVARHVKAFKAGRVYAGGTPLQGPVFYIFQLELAARQVYPELFPPDEPLFDRVRLAAALGLGEGGRRR